MQKRLTEKYKKRYNKLRKQFPKNQTEDENPEMF